MVEDVKSSLFDCWPLSKYIVKLNTAKFENNVAGFSMTVARDAAWQVALACHTQIQAGSSESYLKQRDAEVAKFGNKLFRFPRWLQALLWAARIFEWGTVESKIRRLSR